MPRLRHHKSLIEATEKNRFFVVDLVRINAEIFLRQVNFRNSEMIVETGLSTPADVKGAGDVGFAPFHDFAKLIPVFDLFKIHVFNRCAGDNHAVVLVVLDLFKGLVKSEQMSLGGVLRLMRGRIHHFHLDLKRSISEQSRKLSFRFDFLGHKVEKQNFQRSDILLNRPFFRHYKYIFIMENLDGRQSVRYFNWH